MRRVKGNEIYCKLRVKKIQNIFLRFQTWIFIFKFKETDWPSKNIYLVNKKKKKKEKKKYRKQWIEW